MPIPTAEHPRADREAVGQRPHQPAVILLHLKVEHVQQLAIVEAVAARCLEHREALVLRALRHVSLPLNLSAQPSRRP